MRRSEATAKRLRQVTSALAVSSLLALACDEVNEFGGESVGTTGGDEDGGGRQLPPGLDASTIDAPLSIQDGGLPSGKDASSSDGAAGGADSGGGEVPPPDPCDAVSASVDAKANRATIASCLATRGHATLTAGLFPIDDGLSIPAGTTLRGAPGLATTLRLEPGGGSNFMLSIAGGAALPTTVTMLRLDENHAIGNRANAGTVHTGGTNLRLSDLEIFATTSPPAGYGTTGIYFIGADKSDVLVQRVDIHHHFYGVIFRSGLSNGTKNRIEASKIHENKCDGVTLAGFGEVVGNEIYWNGFDCENGPIPGAGVYSVLNEDGALVQGNTIHDVCGHGIDLDRVARFSIEGNVVRDPGYRFGGFAPACGQAAAGQFASMRDSVVRANRFENTGHPENARPLPPGHFEAKGAAAYSDLPGGTKAVVAAWLLVARDRQTPRSTNNVFEGNTFLANLPNGAGVGVGLYTGRDTGYDQAGNWSAATTNFFTGNVTVGSNVGSVRCGGNWFAGNQVCVAGSPAPCNDDDYQHGATFHGDTCSFY